MSRGGRGGFGANKSAVEKAFNIDYDPALNNLMNGKPSDTFPKIEPPVARPPDPSERASIHHYRTLRARIHDGPFYCILDPSARISKSHRGRAKTPPTALYNPFEEQPTYGQKFRKQRQFLPNLHKRPFVQEYFPRELWGTIGVGVKGERTHALSRTVRIDRWGEGDEVEEGEEEGEEGEEEKEKEEGEEKEEEDEEKDPDQFDEDDEDDDDDYNAEQYFSGGEDDDYGDEGGGGGGDEDM
ncbi:putative DNA-directed RNA polymerase III subunit Rpc31 [Elsinoe australis]|uniref:DNA-directed RNA polymerase III subunit n=1 Tax=Elsinoe australis TaxID=40998 RepID=A0A4U7B4N7_9PEZI|nr:putative DNA-directed RNA polymerase III subunit Rpc31 [Elsinoe australis]